MVKESVKGTMPMGVAQAGEFGFDGKAGEDTFFEPIEGVGGWF